MKLGYECWRRRCTLSELVKYAIERTIEEAEALAIANLQKYLSHSDGAPDYYSR